MVLNGAFSMLTVLEFDFYTRNLLGFMIKMDLYGPIMI